jgi:hypothetical protein
MNGTSQTARRAHAREPDERPACAKLVIASGQYLAAVPSPRARALFERFRGPRPHMPAVLRDFVGVQISLGAMSAVDARVSDAEAQCFVRL